MQPTLSGLHDTARLVELPNRLKIPIQAVINKFDINPEITGRFEKYLSERNIPLAGKLVFEPKMVESMVAEKPIVEFAPDENISRKFFSIWNKIIENNKVCN